MIYPDDRDKDLDAVLTGMVGRRLTVAEVHSALGMPYTTYDAQRKEGRLVSCHNLLAAARKLGINEVELLIRYRIISPKAFERYAQDVFAVSDEPEERSAMRVARKRVATQKNSRWQVRDDADKL
jgi:hypothetical protein